MSPLRGAKRWASMSSVFIEKGKQEAKKNKPTNLEYFEFQRLFRFRTNS